MTAPIDLPGLKVVLINLERSVQRRADMQARLAQLGLAHEWLAGVDGVLHQDALRPSVDVPAFCRNTGRDVLPGEIGCYHSHILAWQKLLDSPQEVLLVLEDDVVFHSDFLPAVRLALAHQGQWDLLKLNCIRAKQPVRKGRIGPYVLNAHLGPFTGMGAYLIGRATIERLLPAMLPITRPIDHELDRPHVHRMRHLSLVPFPSEVNDGNQSTITGTGFDKVRKYPWHRRLPLYALRWRNMVGKIRHTLL